MIKICEVCGYEFEVLGDYEGNVCPDCIIDMYECPRCGYRLSEEEYETSGHLCPECGLDLGSGIIILKKTTH